MKRKARTINFIFIFFSLFLVYSCIPSSSDPSANDNNKQKSETENAPDNNATTQNGNGQNSVDTNNTVKVILQAGPSSVTYSFIDNEGEAYKHGTLLSGEVITINHCKKGQYNIQFKVGSYVATYNVVNIAKNCTLYFGDPNYITVTENNTESNVSPINSDTRTYRVVVRADPWRAMYTFVNDEGDNYKQGDLQRGESITINHFKAGTYHLQFKVGSYVPAYTVISITNDCTIVINNPSSVTIN